MANAVFIENRDQFGNRLCHLPLLHTLRRARPSEELVVFAPYDNVGLFAELGLADRIELYRARPMATIRALRRHGVRRVFSLRPASGWLTLTLGLSAIPRRVGFRSPLGRIFLTDTVPGGTWRYRGLKFLAVTRPLGLDPDPGEVFRSLAEDGRLEAPPGEPRYCLMPGGGAGAFKRWPLERFLALSRELRTREPRARLLWILGAAEGEMEPVILGSDVADASTVLLSRPVPDLALACASSRAVVANDCGPSHVGQMIGVPYVGIFSDHDGEAPKRLPEWFLPRPGSRAVVGEPGEEIGRVPVERVVTAVAEAEAELG